MNEKFGYFISEIVKEIMRVNDIWGKKEYDNIVEWLLSEEVKNEELDNKYFLEKNLVLEMQESLKKYEVVKRYVESFK